MVFEKHSGLDFESKKLLDIINSLINIIESRFAQILAESFPEDELEHASEAVTTNIEPRPIESMAERSSGKNTASTTNLPSSIKKRLEELLTAHSIDISILEQEVNSDLKKFKELEPVARKAWIESSLQNRIHIFVRVIQFRILKALSVNDNIDLSVAKQLRKLIIGNELLLVSILTYTPDQKGNICTLHEAIKSNNELNTIIDYFSKSSLAKFYKYEFNK